MLFTMIDEEGTLLRWKYIRKHACYTAKHPHPIGGKYRIGIVQNPMGNDPVRPDIQFFSDIYFDGKSKWRLPLTFLVPTFQEAYNAVMADYEQCMKELALDNEETGSIPCPPIMKTPLL